MDETKAFTKEVNIGYEIRKVITERKMRIYDLAKRAGVTPASMREILTKTDIGTKRLRQLSELLGVNFFKLYDAADEKSLHELLQQKDAEIKEKDGRIKEVEKELALIREMLEILKNR